MTAENLCTVVVLLILILFVYTILSNKPDKEIYKIKEIETLNSPIEKICLHGVYYYKIGENISPLYDKNLQLVNCE